MKGFTGVADKQEGWGDCACVTGNPSFCLIGGGAPPPPSTIRNAGFRNSWTMALY